MSDKSIFRIIVGISVFVFLVVVVLNRKLIPVTIETPSFVYFLPKLNAIINGTCSVLLLLSLYFIRKKDIRTHKRLNILTFTLSAVFLVSYIIFHYFVKETTYGGTGFIKAIYYFILFTHIILAAVVLPLILMSFQRGLQMQVEKHKKLVRWSYPVWLYVTVTGVIVYLMISPYYTF
jgi:putative membrane protein